MEGLARDECELDDWYCKEEKRGKVHVMNTDKRDMSNMIQYMISLIVAYYDLIIVAYCIVLSSLRGFFWSLL